MPFSSSTAAVALLRALASIEATTPGDPRIAELKRKALLRLAELQNRPKRPIKKMLVLQPKRSE